MEKSFTALSIADIAALNKNALKDFGGFFSELDKNFHNKESLQLHLRHVSFLCLEKPYTQPYMRRFPQLYKQLFAGMFFMMGIKEQRYLLR